MTSRRLLKAAEAIREVVSMAILTEIRDPRVQNVTVTGVEVAPDMKSATVSVSVMGDEGRQHLCLRGLQSSAGFLQSQIAKRIDTRYTPRLAFSLDTGVKKSLEVDRILQELAQEREQRAAEQHEHEHEHGHGEHGHGEHEHGEQEHGEQEHEHEHEQGEHASRGLDQSGEPQAAARPTKPPPGSSAESDAGDVQS